MRFCPPPRPNRFCCAWRASRSDIGAFLTGSGSGSGIFSGFGFFLECFEELDLMDFLDFRERMDTLSISISDSEDSDSKSEVSGFMLWDSRDALSELLEDHPCSEGSDDDDSSFSVLRNKKWRFGGIALFPLIFIGSFDTFNSKFSVLSSSI